jgi:hypothetical protein
MTNPTSNYGWVLPNSADLVTDLPADFDVALQGVDTTLKALNPATTLGDIQFRSATANTNTRLPIGTTGQVLSVVGGVPAWTTGTAGDIEGVTAGVGISGGGTSGTVTVTNSMATAITTAGDLIKGTGSGTFDRLGIGSTGQVLTVSGGAPAWATPAGAGTSWTLLNTGGTTLTGATTITVSGISNKDKIMVVIPLASSVNNNVNFSLRFNTDAGTNYYYYGAQQTGSSTWAASNVKGLRAYAEDSFFLGQSQNTDAYAYIAGTFFLDGGASSGIKSIRYTGGGVNIGYNGQVAYEYGGYYNSASTISSVSIVSTSGNFDDGTIFVYTSS